MSHNLNSNKSKLPAHVLSTVDSLPVADLSESPLIGVQFVELRICASFNDDPLPAYPPMLVSLVCSWWHGLGRLRRRGLAEVNMSLGLGLRFKATWHSQVTVSACVFSLRCELSA